MVGDCGPDYGIADRKVRAVQMHQILKHGQRELLTLYTIARRGNFTARTHAALLRHRVGTDSDSPVCRP